MTLDISGETEGLRATVNNPLAVRPVDSTGNDSGSNANIIYSDYQATLDDSDEIDSGWLDMASVDKVQFSGYASASGMTMTIESRADDNQTALSTPITYNDGPFYLFNVICRQRYMRFRWTNNTGSQVTNASMEIKQTFGGSDKLSVFPVGVQPSIFSQASLTQSINRSRQPDGDYVNDKADGQILVTTSTLAVDGVYTSDWYDTDGWSTLELFVVTDVPSAPKGIEIQYTEDANAGSPTVRGSEFFEFNPVDVAKGSKRVLLNTQLDGFRIIYTNGNQAQGNFFLDVTARTQVAGGTFNSGNTMVTADFDREIAIGSIDNFNIDFVEGRIDDVDTTTTPEDIWNGQGNYTGHNATSNENGQTFSSSTADSGSLVSSGTVTSTSATALIDSSATFITDGVAVGDIVLNDTAGLHGTISSVDSETQVSLNRIRDGEVGQYRMVTGDSYRIATTNGTGAAVVAWKDVLNEDYEKEGTYFVILNGTNNVNTTGNFFRCSKGEVLLAGSGGENAGEITLRQATTTANVFCVMPANKNKTFIAAATVPAGETWLIQQANIIMGRANGSAGSALVTLRTRPVGETFQTRAIFEVVTGGPDIQQYSGGKSVGAKTDIKFTVDSVSDNNTSVRAMLEYRSSEEI